MPEYNILYNTEELIVYREQQKWFMENKQKWHHIDKLTLAAYRVLVNVGLLDFILWMLFEW